MENLPTEFIDLFLLGDIRKLQNTNFKKIKISLPEYLNYSMEGIIFQK